MIKITPVMKDLLDKALADGTPCLIGTASKDGHPQISPKGSVAVFNDDTLCYWERSHRSSQKRLGENPYVVVYYRNPARKENPVSRRLHPLSRQGAARHQRAGARQGLGPDQSRRADRRTRTRRARRSSSIST